MAGASVSVGAAFAITGTAQAATFNVTNTGDSAVPGSGSLRDAITSANASPGSTITFASTVTGTITLGGTELPTVTKPLTIQGPGPSQLAVSGNNASRVFDINASGAVTISGLTVENGKATKGGGIFNSSAPLTVSNSIVSGNTATTSGDYAGGGIYDATGTLNLVNSTLSGNNVATPASNGYGGGLFVYDALTNIQGSTIANNTAHDGGGMYFYSRGSKPITIQNSTVAGNHTTDDGGGIWFDSNNPGHTLTVVGSTITGNAAATRSGGVQVYLSSSSTPKPVIENTIISGNTSGTDPTTNDLRSSRPPFNVAFSLIQNPGPSGMVNSTVPGSNIFGVDPQLGPLADNGGPTQTELPAVTGPVVDQGNAFGLTTDQRGLPRPVDFPSIANAPGGDGSDIGAVELQALPGLTITRKPAPHNGPHNRHLNHRWKFKFEDPAPGVKFLCKLDNQPFEACTSPKVYTHLKHGRHTFTVKSVYPSGKESTPQTASFVVRHGHR